MLDDRYGDTTRALTAFAHVTSYDDLPQAVVEMIKNSIMDQIGIQLALSILSTSAKAAQYARSGGAGPCAVVGHDMRAKAEYAAFVNAVTGHGLELDDMHLPSLNHPGAMVVASALAVGEAEARRGSDLITAVALGYEVMGRIGRGLGPNYVYGHGFHPVGVIGPFGAAVAAAKLGHASESQLFHSIGIAASQGAGTLEYNQTWGESTRLHAGFAAMAGIRSAALAMLGVPGPGAPIEGKYGFARVYSDECNFDEMTRDLGSEYLLLANEFKARPYHAMVHNCVDVTLEALARSGREITDANLDSVERIDIGLCSAGVRGIVEGSQADRFEESLTALNFSLPVPVAHAVLTKGSISAVISFGGVTPAIEALASRVHGHFEERCEQAWQHGKLLATVEIRFSDGDTISCETYRRGSSDNPVDAAQLREKFSDLAGNSVGAARAERVLEMIDRLEQLDRLEPLTTELLKRA